MSLIVQDVISVPAETARVARAAFPNGNVYMKMRDELGVLYQDSEFAALFSTQGRPAQAPGVLNLVLVIQYAEGLSDRQVADAVRSRIDIKYALGLELTDPGFDYSILSEYRQRLIDGGLESKLLDDMLDKFQTQGWLKARGQQRTDSTHVLAATRKLNRLECVGETLRHALNELAGIAPDWVRDQVTADWFDLYGPRFEQYRLPNKKAQQQALADRIGADGYHLLTAVYADTAPPTLRHVPAVQILRQVWIQQYYREDSENVRWRSAPEGELPPNKLLIQTPYDPQARNRTKRSLNWTGYTVHLTETCDPETPHLITNVATTTATAGDVDLTSSIHASLAAKSLLPAEHLVDGGYVDTDNLVASQTEHQVDLVGPAPTDSSWQARAGQGFDVGCFKVDWATQKVICPQGQESSGWYVSKDEAGTEQGIHVIFGRDECAACPQREKCTTATHQGRSIHIQPQLHHETLQAARQRQTTEEFKTRHQARAGVEGTISQGTRAFDLRRARYIGLHKTHLQHILIAAAMNLTRAIAWLDEIPRAQTRRSRFAALAFT